MSCGGGFVDIGANVGFYSALVLAACPDSWICCVEPVPENTRAIVDTLDVFPSERWSVLSGVIAESSAQKLTLQIPAKDRYRNPAGATVMEAGGQKVGSSLTVNNVSEQLKETLASRNVSLIKLDVEGAESAALRALDLDINSEVPMLLIEVLQRNVELIDFLLAPNRSDLHLFGSVDGEKCLSCAVTENTTQVLRRFFALQNRERDVLIAPAHLAPELARLLNSTELTMDKF